MFARVTVLVCASLGLGCARPATAPGSLAPSQGQRPAPPPATLQPAQLRLEYRGPVPRQSVTLQGEIYVRPAKGWSLSQDAPTRVWVYADEKLGNAQMRLDSPGDLEVGPRFFAVALHAVPPGSGLTTLVLRVSSALCRAQSCVPIDQELSLEFEIQESSQ